MSSFGFWSRGRQSLTNRWNREDSSQQSEASTVLCRLQGRNNTEKTIRAHANHFTEVSTVRSGLKARTQKADTGGKALISWAIKRLRPSKIEFKRESRNQGKWCPKTTGETIETFKQISMSKREQMKFYHLGIQRSCQYSSKNIRQTIGLTWLKFEVTRIIFAGNSILLYTPNDW